MARKSNQKLRVKKSSNGKGPAIPPGKDEPSAARKTRTVWSQKAASEQGGRLISIR